LDNVRFEPYSEPQQTGSVEIDIDPAGAEIILNNYHKENTMPAALSHWSPARSMRTETGDAGLHAILGDWDGSTRDDE
jgi:hypothetical protein